MNPNEQKSNSPDDDPGNLRDAIDATVHVHADHRAIDGGDHVLPEDLERFEADQRHADQQAAIDENNQPESEVRP